ncbi:MAG: hypothetical protein M3356_01090 [Actinomycetota bacterium]|nr:hypothetical protein [Actinomycetota bacterium]
MGKGKALAVVAALVGVALIAALAFALNDDEGADRGSGELTADQVKDGKPTIASTQDLRSFADSVGHPVFWAGELPNLKLELTAADEKVWVRYLPAGIQAGDKGRKYLTVGTYPQPQPFADLEKASKKPGTVSEIIPGGGRLLYYRKNAQSVYLAYPATDYLVELYSPSAPQALKLVQSGSVGQVR